MIESEIDMDELEARLYGQVHYPSDSNETPPTHQELLNARTKNYMRYFDGTPSTPSTPMGLYSIPVISPPINNIVVLPSPSAQVYNHQPNSQKWVEQLLHKYETARSKSKRKFNKLKRKTKERKRLSLNKHNSNVVDKSVISTIDLSENCDPAKAKVCVISDDNSNSSDDVVIIEPQNEIINVDCDIEPTLSPISSDSLNVTELNASNDFLDSTKIPKGKTSTPHKDIYETISNCSSTMDYTENLKAMDGGEFTTVRTNSTFSELNLDSFTNYIASNGKRSADIATLTSSAVAAKKPRRISADSSDSSSESEDLGLETISDNEDVLDLDQRDAGNDVGQVSVVEAEKDEENVICIDDEKSNASAAKTKYEPERFSKYWTEDMNKFYKESWGQEKFSVIEEQRRMSDDPNMWKIIARDRVTPGKGSREPRCRRCLEFGHIGPNCTKNLGPIKCCLCGLRGHRETRCPNTFCTSCREKTPYYTTFCSKCVSRREATCSMCDMTGHHTSNCPDLWRRYLFTTKNGAVQQPTEADVKVAEDRWCSGCGMNGHFEQHCYYYNRSHAPVSVFIHSFQDAYPPRNVAESSQSSNTTKVDAVDELQDSWHLDQTNNKFLNGKEAKIFLKLLSSITSVTVKVEKSQSLLLLLSGGTSESRETTKAAIRRFIEAKKALNQTKTKAVFFYTKKATLKALKCNLDTLKKTRTDWLGAAKKIYKHIKNLTLKVKDCTKQDVYKKHQATLKTLYQKLNTIIIAKLRIGSDKHHMDTLEECVRKKKVTLYSFEYVFNSAHILYPNYEELIKQLPQISGESTGRRQYALYESMKDTAVALCTKWKWRSRLKRILMTYCHLVISNYSNRYASVFKSSCTRICTLARTCRRQSAKSGSKK